MLLRRQHSRKASRRDFSLGAVCEVDDQLKCPARLCPYDWAPKTRTPPARGKRSFASEPLKHAPAMAPILKLYPFKYRDAVSGIWTKARYKATIEDIRARYAEWIIDGDPPPARRQCSTHTPRGEPRR